MVSYYQRTNLVKTQLLQNFLLKLTVKYLVLFMVLLQKEIEINLPKESDTNMIHVADYYMNNREVFVNFINTLFRPYKEEMKQLLKEIFYVK